MRKSIGISAICYGRIQLIDTLKAMYNDEVILSYNAKTIETVKDGVFYKLTLEVTTQDGILKFSPNIIKEQGVCGALTQILLI